MSASVACPALLIAAPASGQGKTTVVAALARLLARRGWAVRVFKCGPDFLDPFWHELASGQPVHHLDLWMTGEADIRARLHAAARQADVLLIEGVMGLHDGSPSAADMARLLGLPVLAVVQAGRMVQTLGAVAHGLQHYRAAQRGPLPWAGVLANGVASEGHARLLRESLEQPESWLGHLPRSDAMRLPERHLGLVAARELGQAQALARLDAAADALAGTPLGCMRLDDWRDRWAVPFAEAAVPPAPPLLAGRTVAVARDAAFAFIYPANIDTLHALGARVVFFSPLAGDALPACDALWLPGGYPELHAPALAARTDLRAQLHQHALAGKPIWAECGGMMALLEHLHTADGQSHSLWGLLPGHTAMQTRLAGLGMQQWDMADVPGMAGNRDLTPIKEGDPHLSTRRGERAGQRGAIPQGASGAPLQPPQGMAARMPPAQPSPSGGGRQAEGRAAGSSRGCGASHASNAVAGLAPATSVVPPQGGRRASASGGSLFLRGHSFHYSTCTTPLAPIAHTRPAPGSARPRGEAVYARGAVRASYFHAWFASCPQAAARLFLPDAPEDTAS